MTPPSTGNPSKPRRFGRLSINGWLLVVIAVVTVAGTVAVVLWNSEPDYWRRNEAFQQAIPDNATLLHMATSLERRLIQGVSARLPNDHEQANGQNPDQLDPRDQDQAYPVFLPTAEINAWLRVKLKDWLAYKQLQLPLTITDFMIAIDPDRQRVILAFRYVTPEVKQIMSLHFEPRLLDTGELVVRLAAVRSGMLPVPLSAITRHIDKNTPGFEADDQTRHLREFTLDPVIEHPGDQSRRLRLLGMDLLAEGLRLYLRSETIDVSGEF